MKYPSLAPACLVLALSLSASAIAQTSPTHQKGMEHSARMDRAPAIRMKASMPTEVGQAAFAAIAEIVKLLQADPDTDWGKVDIGALRRHLIDMDNVTLRAAVKSQPVEGGARFDVTSGNGEVAASIRRMAVAHAATMSGVNGLRMEAAEIPAGARLSVTGANAQMIRGLGFIGVMTLGMHHQAHHLALARGINPHGH